jgi:hypothetical protein
VVLIAVEMCGWRKLGRDGRVQIVMAFAGLSIEKFKDPPLPRILSCIVFARSLVFSLNTDRYLNSLTLCCELGLDRPNSAAFAATDGERQCNKYIVVVHHVLTRDHGSVNQGARGWELGPRNDAQVPNINHLSGSYRGTSQRRIAFFTRLHELMNRTPTTCCPPSLPGRLSS